ncbi:hypothetical protein T440DRAFT_506405 [Plenodomus tracheiphilus IPT5]|uniref:Mid2 domain-containing protein n=1 Tax=Plenodomus tracheiphilus IPT5 TaxID=1408161 RepID=A0A6A7BDD6_9PLEO|nr:hypothetical protein T440DRAFT_506405 [Plenodomus tracheiphilus IPT5]
MRLGFSLAAALLAGTSYAQSATCHFANGTALPDSPVYNEFEPCTAGPTTICCASNRALPPGAVRDGTAGGTRDECKPNGLCQNRYIKPNGNGSETISFWVDFCTDSNVISKDCLSVCRPRSSFGNVQVTPCNGRADSETWCCGGTTACCGTTSVVMIAQVLGGTLSPSVTSSATSAILSTGQASSTPGTSAGPSASHVSLKPSESSGISTGAIAGIAIGVVAGLGLFGVAMFVARRSRRRKKEANASHLAEVHGNTPTYQPRVFAVEKDSYAQRVELPPIASPTELPPARPVELPADTSQAQ